MTVFTTALKRVFKQPLNWVFILMFPVIFIILIAVPEKDNDVSNSTDAEFHFGAVDLDNSVLSRMLVKQLKLRYNVIDIAEADITAVLTDSEMPWVLLIREGYGNSVLSGQTPLLESYSLTISDISALGSVTAQNITQALMLLGSDDSDLLAEWEDASRIDVTMLNAGDNWGLTAFWLSFFGYVSIYTAYFIIKTLLDDKRGGMPDRIGVLPITPRRYLVSGTFAGFCATEVTAALLLVVLQMQLGVVANALYLFLLLSLYNLFSVGMVLAITSIARDLGAASVTMTMISTAFAMLGGLFWPLEFAPEFMKKLAWFSPGYWLSRGIENIRQITFEGYVMPMLFLTAFTVVVLLLGGWQRVQALDE